MSFKGNVEIYSYLKSLKKSFPIREDVGPDFVREVFQKFSGKSPEEAIVPIKNQMGLGENKVVKVTFYNDHAFFRQYSFQKSQLPDWNQRMLMGYGISSTPFLRTHEKIASIDLTNIPLYGTKSFSNKIIWLTIGKSVLFQSVEFFIQVIAHELSHFLLMGLRHPLFKSEKATDLLSMVVGYNRIVYKNGNMAGYLTPAQTKTAYWLIKSEQIIQKAKKYFH